MTHSTWLTRLDWSASEVEPNLMSAITPTFREALNTCDGICLIIEPRYVPLFH